MSSPWSQRPDHRRSRGCCAGSCKFGGVPEHCFAVRAALCPPTKPPLLHRVRPRPCSAIPCPPVRAGAETVGPYARPRRALRLLPKRRGAATSTPPCDWGEYDGALRDAILRVKSPLGEGLAELLGEALLRNGDEAKFAALGVEAVVPVPLHWRRRFLARLQPEPRRWRTALASRLRLAHARRWWLRRVAL